MFAGDGGFFMVVADRQVEKRGTGRYGEQLAGAELVGEFLKYVGAEYLFGIPGGASLPLNDAFTLLHEAGDLRYVLTGHEQGALVRAYHAAVTGRPGAVLVDLPRDVQVGKAEMRPWEDFLAEHDFLPPPADAAALAEAARLLARAERPLLFAGNGVNLSG